MNASNKVSLSRIFLIILITFICLFPFYSIGFNFPKINIDGLVVDSTYFVSGFIFMIVLFTNYFDNVVAKKNNTVSDRAKLLDKTVNELLISVLLIIFAIRGFIPSVVPVIYVFLEEMTNFLSKDLLQRGYKFQPIKADVIKSMSLLIGLLFMFFYNLPFELLNLKVADFLIYFGTIMSIVSTIEYYRIWKKVK